MSYLEMPLFTSGAKPITGSDLELIELVGESTSGEMWRAKHTDQPLQPDVFLKLISNPFVTSDFREKIDYFYAVTKKTKQLSGSVEFRGAYIQNDPLAIEFEFIDGKTLVAIFKVLIAKSKIDYKLITSYMYYIFLIVGKAHNLGVIHGNLKPENIFITKSKRLKISGFGFDEILKKNHKLEVERVLDGFADSDRALSSFYSSPQQKNGQKSCKLDDVYALGVIWYQLVCCDFTIGPVSGSAWKRRLLEKGATEESIKLIEQCMESSPEDRPNDLLEVAKQIKENSNPSQEKLKETTESGPVSNPEDFPLENFNSKKDVFISYRSLCSKDFAHSLYKLLKEKKYRVFFDEHELPNGRWDQHLYENVANAKDFVLIIAKKTLENCGNPDDWVLKEILEAKKLKKNIVPIFHDDATWDSVSCPKNLEWLKLLQGEKWLIAHEDSCFDKLKKKLTAKRLTYSRVVLDLLIVFIQFIYSNVIKSVSSLESNHSPTSTVVTNTKDSSFGNSISKFKKLVIVTAIGSLFCVSFYLLVSYLISLFSTDFDFDKISYAVIPEKKYGKSWSNFKEIEVLNDPGAFVNITGFSDEMIYVSTKKNEIIRIGNKKARVIYGSPENEESISIIRVVDNDNAIAASFKGNTAVWLHIKPTGVEKVSFSKKIENIGGFNSEKKFLKYQFNKFGFIDKSNVHMFDNYTASHRPIVAFDKKEPLDLNKYKLNLNEIYPRNYAQVQFQLEKSELSGYTFLWSHFQGNTFYSSVFKKDKSVKILDYANKIESIRLEDSDGESYFAFGSSKDNFFVISDKGKVLKRNKDKFDIVVESLNIGFNAHLNDIWVSNTGKIYGVTDKEIYFLEPQPGDLTLLNKSK